MQKNKLFIKYDEVLNRSDLEAEVVTQLINWLGHPVQSLINDYFIEKFQYFNSNQFKTIFTK